jgi:predicted Zn-dependent peptidase
VTISGESTAQKVRVLAENYFFKSSIETNENYVTKLKSVNIEKVLDLFKSLLTGQRPEIVTLDL